MPELPTNLVSYLEALEDDVIPTDVCLDTFDHIYTLALEGTPVLLDVLSAFVSTCLGG